MKYLKSINEKNYMYVREQVKEICDNYLSYLIDNGYQYSITVTDEYCCVVINHKDMVKGKLTDVIYDISQFKDVLESKYKVIYMNMYLSNNLTSLPDYYRIYKSDLSDPDFIEFNGDKYFSEIRIYIK